MPIGFSNGLQFEDEFEMTQHFAKQPPITNDNMELAPPDIDWEEESKKLPVRNVGIFDSIFGKKEEPTVKETYGKAPPMEGYPSSEDVEFAKKAGYYNDIYEPFTTGKTARILGQSFKSVNGKGKASSFFSAVSGIGLDKEMFDNPEKLSAFVESNPQLAELYAKGQLAANRIPVAAIGFDPNMTMLDTKIGKDVNVAGLYNPKSDMMYVNAEHPAVIVHESIHRGMETLRKEHPEFFKENKLPSEEYVVRYLMATQAGNVEKGMGSVGDKQIENANYLFEKGGLSKEYKQSLEKLTRLAEDYLGKKNSRRGHQ